MHYTPKTFVIPELEGISPSTVAEHLGLYAGYVKHVNLIQEKIVAFQGDLENNAYAIAEMQRRLGFEFGGMRNHEYYFEQFEGGPQALPEGAFSELLIAGWGSVEAWHDSFKRLAMTRGVGWAMLYIDRTSNQLVQTWVDEQHLGQLPEVSIIMALDMWEHAYMVDYTPAEKAKYVEAFWNLVNWDFVASQMK